MRDNRQRLRDILAAIAQIEKYAIHGQTEFQRNELIQIWIVHHLQIIGEAASSLSEEITNRYSQVPWAEILTSPTFEKAGFARGCRYRY